MIARRILLAVAALLTGALAGCHAPPPPPEPPPLPVPPPFVRPPPEVVSGRWSFAITGAACIANVSNRDVSLTLRIGRDDNLELSVAGRKVRSVVTRAGRRARFRFEGAAGAWSVPARSSGDLAVVAIVPLSETTASHVLGLLGGGHLRTDVGTALVPVLRLPDSDVAGREWFDCVRSELERTAPGS